MKLLLLLLVAAVGVVTSENIVCYFSSWAVYRPGNGKFDVDDIDPFLCTHLIFSFTGLSNVTWEIEILDPWNELCPDEEGGHNCAMKRFVSLKETNPKLNIMVAIGGWNEGSEDYSVMAADPVKRGIFVQSVVALLEKRHFEGLDVDWEYPNARGGRPEDKENYVTVIKELREAFNKHSPPYILTGALPAGKPTIDAGFDVPSLIPLFDQFHIMTYDYHGCWENTTHHNAPLCGYYADEGDMKYFNIHYTINYYIDMGIPRKKIMMGAPLYGRCYQLDNIEEHGMLAPASKCGSAGPYVRIPGTMAANEICLRKDFDDTCHIVRDPNLHEPYFYCGSDNLWCGFDDAESLYVKARYAKNMGLGGVIAWTMDEDDFIQECYERTFHLIKTMKEALEEPAGGDMVNCSIVITTPVPDTTTPLPTTEVPTTTRMPTTTEVPTTEVPTTEVPTTTAVPTTTELPTTEVPTTTAVPTTTELPTTEMPTTEVPTTAPPTTTVPTDIPTTGFTVETTTHDGGHRPNCTGQPDGTLLAHTDCDKYWECISGIPILMGCAPGTLFDITIPGCNWEKDVDTSDCRYWTCDVDNTFYPHEDCNKYYWCYNGSPHLQTCKPETNYWQQSILQCVDPSRADTSGCNPI